MSKSRKKTARVLLIIYLVIFGIPAAVFALLRTPIVQHYMAQKLAEYLSDELKTKVEIERVDVTFPIDIRLYGLYIEDQYHQPMISADELTITPQNTNLDFGEILFGQILLENASFNLMKYKGEKELNIQFLIKYFAGEPTKKTTKSKPSPTFIADVVELRNCSFAFHDQNRKGRPKSSLDFNNLQVRQINVLAENLFISDTLTSANVKHIALADHSGFMINHLAAQIHFTPRQIAATNLQLLSPASNLNLDFAMQVDSMRDFADFENKVRMNANFRTSRIGWSDISWFVPTLRGMSADLSVTGQVSGTVSDLKAEQFRVGFGKNSHMFLHASILGLPDVQNAKIHLDLVNAKLLVNDLDQMVLPGGKTLGLARSLGAVSQASLTGSFDGGFNGFSANVVAETNAGFLKADVNSQGPIPNNHYQGSVVLQNFDLKPVAANNPMLGPITAVLNFQGHGATAQTYNVSGEADISSIFFNGYTYSGIRVSGKTRPGIFEGHLIASDPNANLDFDGMIGFSEEAPVFNFIARIENLNLNPLHFNRNENDAAFNGYLDINVTGSNPDHMLGRISLNDFTYYEGVNELSMNALQIRLTKVDSLNKSIELRSDLVNGDINGTFVFAEISEALQQYLTNYIPSYFHQSDEVKQLADQSFSFDFKIKDIQPVLDIFAPGITVSAGAIAKGNFNQADHYLRAEIAANSVGNASVRAINPVALIETFNSNIYLTLQSDRLLYNDSLELGNLVANAVTNNDHSAFSVFWKNDNSPKAYSGDLTGSIIFEKGKPLLVSFAESDITLNDSLYHIAANGRIAIDTSYIRIQDFAVYSNAQRLMIDGYVSHDPYDVVQVTFQNVLLDDFDDLTRSAGVNLDGNLNGYLLLSNLYDVPDYRSDLDINKLFINSNFVGDAKLVSSWDDVRQAVYSEISISYSGNVGTNIPLDIKGFFNPRDKENMLDLAINLDRFNLKLIQPYLKSFSHKIDGTVDGKITVKGNIEKPDVNGYIAFRRTNLLVDYLNMFYSFTDTLLINNHEISMRNTTVFDSKGNPASADLIARHDHFRDFVFDMTLRPKKMQFLNTTARDNDYFYGQAFASGLVRITGPPNQVSIEVAATTDPGSVIYIPITSGSEVYQNDFITFTGHKTDSANVKTDIRVKDSGINLVFDIDVTPDAEIQIVFDPKIGDVMKGRGKGRLKMTIDRSGEFLMFGNLEIEQGDYLFTLENVINKKFLVDPGGTISWNGDPYNGIMDLYARYKIKTSLYELISVADPSEIYKNKVPVHCLMHLTGNLLSPGITFDIDLPESDENTRNLVRTIIGNAEEMNRQVFALLIINSFIPAEQNTFNNGLSQGIGNTSFELLSNQFSNWLSQISNDFDVDFSYNQGDEVTSTQVEVALSTQLLNDRIVIETNVAIGGNQVGATDDQNASNIAGDVSIEYKISEDGKLRVKAFNRSNTVDVVTNNAPYTQGVALFYRREFDRFRDLWRRNQSKKN